MSNQTSDSGGIRQENQSKKTGYPLWDLDTPEELLDFYMREPVNSIPYLGVLMNCVHTHDIEAIVRCIPSDLFDQFKKTISHIAEYTREEDFIVIGRPVKWGIKDAKRVHQWLLDHPEPELAPRDERVWD